MTVKELIELLQKENPDFKIRTNGCRRCVHDVTGIEEDKDGFIDGREEVWLTISED